jgi:hypothetical protein
MPDIINNVVQDYASSSHSIYVCEIAPFFKTPGLYNQQWKSLGGYRVVKNTTGTRSHLWDLYLLAVQMDNTAGYLGYQTRLFGSDFYPLFCSNFTDNGGDNVYQPVQNFSGMSVLNHPTANNYQYTGSFSFSPLFSTNVNQQGSAEAALYRASFIPLYPLLFCSSIPTHKSFGPAFLSSFSISVDGMDSLGDVTINCSMIGGRSIISPDNIPIKRPILMNNLVRMKNLEGSAFLDVESNNFQDKYRTMNLSDCAFYPDLFTGANAFQNFGYSVQNWYKDATKMPVYKIVSMSLNISQSIDLTYTYPGYSVGDQIIEFTDVVGPRFASLSSRKVTGSIKLFSPQNYSFINTNASSLTLYFGSVFFYTMKNVDWQQPIVTINPGSGYFIEYNFTVRLTEITAFNGKLNPRVSEFL